jgi:predicted phage tail protein
MPPTATFTGALSGADTAVLNWQTTDATSATINGASVALSGTVSYALTVETTYTLVATGPGGSVTRTATVTPTAVDCVTSDWSFQSATAWSVCVGGQQSRTETWTRSVLVQPRSGGLACGALEEQRVVTQACTAAPTAPAAPINVKASVSGQQVTLSWAPNPTGGAPNGYLVSVGTRPGASDLANSVSVGNVLSVTSAALGKGSYYARVKAANALGMSPNSSEVSFKIGGKGKPRSPGALFGSFEEGVVTLSWSAPAVADGSDDSPTGYVIEAGSAPGLSNLAVVPLGNVTRFQAASVPAGVYYVRVRAVNEEGASDASNEIVLSSSPIIGAPLNLTDSGTGLLVSLSWDAPRTGGLAAGYVIEAGSRSGLADLAVLRLGNTTSFATMAPPGTYYVRVRAVDASGHAGEASNEIVVRR